MSDESGTRALSRRDLLRRAGVGVGGLALSGVAAQPIWARPKDAEAYDAASTITIGFVSPLTGPAAGFGEPDPYVLGLARKAFATGLTVGGKHYAVKIVNKDSQSAPAQAAKVAGDLIHGTKVDLMLATSTPEVVNPVADACEAAGVPYITTVVPWEAWYFGRGAKDPTKSPFRYGIHFCFGTANFAHAYTHLWPQVKTNKKVGVMWPNDADGNAIREALGPLLEKAGYTIVDPGAYQDGTNDYSAQIAKFKAENCQIFNTFPIPPDFATFWRQAAQQGYTKIVKIAQIAKTGLFPSQVTSLGAIGNNLASACYWHPTFPYRSSLTGLTSKQLADGYIKHAKKQWN
ncbi:MAG: ABC transporter substrate-binding protein, partial [Thermoleophilia bacterium]|nr:ABC transporter substrate-binding protein [Thermoleophilia bacterium]